MPRIELAVSAPVGVILLLIAAAVVAAVVFYRTTRPPVPRSRRLLLTALRAVILSLLFCLLCEPLLHVITSSRHRPGLAVLVDNSRSMRLVDRTGDRAARLRAVLSSDVPRTVASTADIRYYTFGTSLQVISSPLTDTLQLSDDATDIASALRSLRVEHEQHPIRAALLISDGSFTLGNNPLYDARELGMPLYTVGIGDSSEQKDLLITKVVANDLVYAGTPSPVDVTIKSSGFLRERVEVTLSDAGWELARGHVQLAEGTREYEASLTYLPEGNGTKTYDVAVSRLPGELTPDNNQRRFTSRVLRSKLRLLLLAGTPGPDASILRQTLAEQPNFSVRSYTQRFPSGFLEGHLSPSQLDTADCLVLIGIPTPATPAATIALLQTALIQQGKPFLFVNGKSVTLSRFGDVASLFPVTGDVPSEVEQLVSVQPADAQRSNPLVTFGDPEQLNAWSRLPPLFKTQTVFRATPEAVVLALCRVNNVTTSEPLILSRALPRHKSIAITGYGLWRWRLMAQGSAETAPFLSRFLTTAIRWLTTPEDTRPVRVTPLKPSFAQGEPVEFVGQVYDATAHPVPDARLHIIVEREGTTLETDVRPVGAGRYEGSLRGLLRGQYSFRATALSAEMTAGEDSGTFFVGDVNLEYQDTRMNIGLLRQLAYQTGGRYFPPEELASLNATLRSQASFLPHEETRKRDIELWNWPIMLILAVLALAVEWTIRKRSGML